MTRRYGQLCGIARALDVVGDRWALLVVRDLILGPRRYTDLLEGLPGITTNLLAKRLAELEAAGVVTREPLPPPARAQAYALTELGRRLEPALLALGAFGEALPLDPEVDYRGDPRWAVLSFRRRFRGARRPFAVELRVAGRTFALRGGPDGLDVRDGASLGADATLSLEPEGFLRFYRGRRPLREVEAAGLARVEGRRGAVTALARSVGLSP